MGKTGVDMNMFIDTVNMARTHQDVMKRQQTGLLENNSVSAESDT